MGGGGGEERGEKAGGGKVDIHLMLFESLKRKKRIKRKSKHVKILKKYSKNQIKLKMNYKKKEIFFL